MQVNELEVKRQIEEMILWSSRPLHQFPRHERHVLSAEIRLSMYQLLRLVVAANRKYYKKTTLQDMDIELDVLRTQVRISMELGHLKFKDYEQWAKRLASVGSLLGGWIKWAKSKA